METQLSNSKNTTQWKFQLIWKWRSIHKLSYFFCTKEQSNNNNIAIIIVIVIIVIPNIYWFLMNIYIVYTNQDVLIL